MPAIAKEKVKKSTTHPQGPPTDAPMPGILGLILIVAGFMK
jgi:hypothetical protein